MARMTAQMFVQLQDEKLIKQHGKDPCMILEVRNKREFGEIVPERIVLSSMTGAKFEALPHQVAPY